jgi:uncharacterized membrane protein YfcA
VAVPIADMLSDPLFWVAALAAFAAALIRGFSGFGAGLVFMPVGAACFGPKTAAGVLFVVDTILIVPFVLKAVRIVDWREILPLGFGAVLAVPAGALILLNADPIPLRWGLSLAILASVGALAAGWRYRGPTRAWLSALVGAVAGFMSGAAQIPGPPVLIYWLGREVVSATMRANAIVFFCFTTIVSGSIFWAGGLFTAQVMTLSAALFPVYAIGIVIGARMFGRASEATYRRIAYASILFVAIASLPVFG